MIYCVEDDAGIRELEVYSLERAGYRALGCDSAGAFRACFDPAAAELILLDIMLPGESGLRLLEALRAAPESAGVPVILVTALGAERDKVTGLDAGADDYIAKPFGVLELLARVRAVLRRRQPPASRQWTAGAVCLDEDSRRVTVRGKEVSLTRKEYGLLLLLLQSGGGVLTREQLLEQVWGIDCQVETRTVDVHVRTLRQKLREGGNIIETVRGVGYRLAETREP